MAAGKQVLELHGLGKLIRSLEALTPAMEAKVLRTAMRAAAKPILAQAIANAPVGKSAENDRLASNTAKFGALFGATGKQIAKAQKRAVKNAITLSKKAGDHYPGQLRDSLKIRAMKRKKGRVGFLVQTRAGDFKGDTYYAAFQEYGTSKMPGKGYIRRAFDTKKAEAESIAATQIKAGIEQLAAQLGGK